MGWANDPDGRRRQTFYNAIEPEGSYGLCWKFITPDDPASDRCTLKPGHDGECHCEDADDPV